MTSKNFTNINETNNHFSPEFDKKNTMIYDIGNADCRSWFGTNTNDMAGLNRLFVSPHSILDNWIFNGKKQTTKTTYRFSFPLKKGHILSQKKNNSVK